MIYDSNMTVEEIIGQSLKNAKQLNQQKRRKWVRRMLNYYGGNSTHNYIQDYFSADAFKENAIRQHGSVEAYRKALVAEQQIKTDFTNTWNNFKAKIFDPIRITMMKYLKNTKQLLRTVLSPITHLRNRVSALIFKLARK